MDTKLRNIDETLKGAELQIEVMSRTNADLVSRLLLWLLWYLLFYKTYTILPLFNSFLVRLQEEKEARRLVTAENDNSQKALRKAQENLKMVISFILFFISLHDNFI